VYESKSGAEQNEREKRRGLKNGHAVYGKRVRMREKEELEIARVRARDTETRKGAGGQKNDRKVRNSEKPYTGLRWNFPRGVEVIEQRKKIFPLNFIRIKSSRISFDLESLADVPKLSSYLFNKNKKKKKKKNKTTLHGASMRLCTLQAEQIYLASGFIAGYTPLLSFAVHRCETHILRSRGSEVYSPDE